MKFHWGDMLCNNKKHEKPQAWFTVDVYLGDRQRCPCNVITLCAVMCYHIHISLFLHVHVSHCCIWHVYVYMFVSAGMHSHIFRVTQYTISRGKRNHTQPANSSSDFISVLTVYFAKEFIFLLWLLSAPRQTVKQRTDTHPLWERSGRTDVEHLWHVLWVALLSHIAQFGRDVDAPADVHVHPPGFLLNLGVQFRHLLQGRGWLFKMTQGN